jgi:hypothetical protein
MPAEIAHVALLSLSAPGRKAIVKFIGSELGMYFS